MSASEKGQEAQSNVSVFDFVYADHSRIGTIISQFSNFGNLTSIVHDVSAEKGTSESSSVDTKGNAAVVSATHTVAGGNHKSHAEASQRSYDPKWINALSFLDQIEEKDLLKRSLNEATLGDLVLITGPVQIRDFATLKKLWGLPTFRAFAELGADTQPASESRNERKQKRKERALPSEIDLFFEMIDVLPHPAQITIGDDPVGWGILDERGMMSTASDHLLKYGGPIPGTWAVVGILDAYPSITETPEIVHNVGVEQIVHVLFGQIEPITRQLLGRPSEAFGITPLLVFREVGS